MVEMKCGVQIDIVVPDLLGDLKKSFKLCFLTDEKEEVTVAVGGAKIEEKKEEVPAIVANATTEDFGTPDLFGVKPKPRFKYIRKNGLITINFGVEMIFGDELIKDTNSDTRRLASGRLLEVKVVPGWSQEEDGYAKVLDFKWELINAKEKNMVLLVTFKHWKWVSQGDTPCRLEVKFVDGERFRAAVGGKYVDTDTTLKKWLPHLGAPAGADGSANGLSMDSIGGAVGGTLSGLFGTTGAANFFVSFGLSNLWSMINGI